MTTTTGTWWESIFSGPLSHGICEEKLLLLQDEAFYISLQYLWRMKKMLKSIKESAL